MNNKNHHLSFIRRGALSCAVATCLLSFLATSASAQSSTGSNRESTTRGSDRSQQSTSGASGTGTSSSERGRSSTYGTSGSAGSTNTASSLDRADRRFLEKAASSGHKEMSLTQLAVSRASGTDVRNLAQQLSTDHQQMHSELMALAQRKGISLGEEMDRTDRHVRKLTNQAGKEFDKEYLEEIKDVHEDDVRLFEKAARDAKDTEVREFAAKYLPILRDHLNKVKDLEKML